MLQRPDTGSVPHPVLVPPVELGPQHGLLNSREEGSHCRNIGSGI